MWIDSKRRYHHKIPWGKSEEDLQRSKQWTFVWPLQNCTVISFYIYHWDGNWSIFLLLSYSRWWITRRDCCSHLAQQMMSSKVQIYDKSAGWFSFMLFQLLCTPLQHIYTNSYWHWKVYYSSNQYIWVQHYSTLSLNIRFDFISTFDMGYRRLVESSIFKFHLYHVLSKLLLYFFAFYDHICIEYWMLYGESNVWSS